MTKPTDPSAPPLPTLERLRRELIRRWDTGFESVDDAASYFDDLVRAVRLQSGALRVREEEGHGEQQKDHGARAPVRSTASSADVDTEPLPISDRELAVQLIIRFARGGNEHQLSKARGLLGLPWTWEPNHSCSFCEVPLSRHWSDVVVNQIDSGNQPSQEQAASPHRSEAPKNSSSNCGSDRDAGVKT